MPRLIIPTFAGINPMPLLFLPLMTVILAFVIAACGSSSSGPSASFQPTIPDQDALDLLKGSAEVGNTMKSGRVHADMNSKTLGENVAISIDIDLARNGWIKSIIETKSRGIQGTIEQVIVSPDIYMKADRTGGWVRLNIQELAAQAGVSVESFKSISEPRQYARNIFLSDDIPWDLYTVRSLGTQKIDGVKTEHLGVEVDFAEVWNRLTPEEKQELTPFAGQIQSLAGSDLEEASQSIQYKDVEVWIDDRGLAVQTSITMSMTINMVDVELNIDTWIKDYNEDIEVKAPDEYRNLR